MTEPKTHDYRKSEARMGHDLSYTPLPNNRLSATGWGRGISVSDFVLLTLPDGGETRYRFDEISYFGDPPDMWRSTLSFAPRTL